MKDCLLIRDDIKVHSLPHSMTKKVAHILLPGDDDQVHSCAVATVPSDLWIFYSMYSVVLIRHIPATRRIVPMIPQIGLVTAEGGMSCLPVEP